MSGICAVWKRDNPGLVPSVLADACRGLALTESPRESHETDANAGVAVSARFPTQQLFGNSRVLVACDTDLLNEQELRQWIGERSPHAESPIAALLAGLYVKFGADFAAKLKGAFSFALWDRGERRLVAAVDGFGMKRLVYSFDGKTLLLGSRIQSLAATGEVDLTINPHTIPNLLNFSMNLAPETAFRQVRRLPPGCMLIAAKGELHVNAYWDMRYGSEGRADENALSRELESLFEKTVADYCQGQPFDTVGAFLSGGTDSSTVVGMMSRANQGPVNAFSIGFQEQQFDELEYARLAAKRFGAKHYTYLVGPDESFEALPEMVRYFDEPFGNSSAIPTYFCSKYAAQEGMSVLLAGDGGDELFGGNERYATDRIYRLYHSIPGFMRSGIIEPMLSGLPMKNGIVGRARRYVGRANMPGMDRILCHQFLCTHAAEDIFEPGFLKELNGYSILDIPRQHYDKAPAKESLDRILYADVKMTLGDSDLPKVTCMAELAGIRVRFPFLDRAVAEFSARLPVRMKVNGFDKRYLFKKAFRNLLPVEIIKKKKHGFGIPVSDWMKTHTKFRELSRDTLLSRESLERGYFRRDFLDRIFRMHEADSGSYYGDILWTFLVLELWHRQLAETRMSTAR